MEFSTDISDVYIDIEYSTVLGVCQVSDWIQFYQDPQFLDGGILIQ
jgi:hypothetical protein